MSKRTEPLAEHCAHLPTEPKTLSLLWGRRESSTAAKWLGPGDLSRSL